MKKSIFIKPSNTYIELTKTINNIEFEDSNSYRFIIFNFEENIIYSEDNVPQDISKKLLYIENPFTLELNNKKIMTVIYKIIEKNITFKEQEKIANIYNLLDELCVEFSQLFDYKLTYDNEIKITNLLSSISLRIEEISKDNYLEYLVNYIKINKEFLNINIILAVNLLNVLNEEEVLLLEKELVLLNINLINISMLNKSKKNIDLLIDSDWCTM